MVLVVSFPCRLADAACWREWSLDLVPGHQRKHGARRTETAGVDGKMWAVVWSDHTACNKSLFHFFTFQATLHGAKQDGF